MPPIHITYMSFWCYLQAKALKRGIFRVSHVSWCMSFMWPTAARVHSLFIFIYSSSRRRRTALHHVHTPFPFFSFTLRPASVASVCECVFGLSRINIFLLFPFFFFHPQNYRFAVPMDVYLVRLWYRNVPTQSQYNSYIQRRWFFLFIIICTEEKYTLSA